MSKTLKRINHYIAEAKPSDYDSVSYNTYFRNLTDISNVYLEEKEFEKAQLKQEILKIQDDSLRLKILELLQ